MRTARKSFIHFSIYTGIVLVAIVCFSPAMAQSPCSPGLQAHRFYNTTTAGLLAGDATGSSFQTMIGYQFRYRFHVGAGTGMDGFNTIRIVPLFAAFSADLLQSKITPFGFIHAGAAFPWLEKNQYLYGSLKPSKNETGPYLQAGIGQKLRLGGNTSIQLSIGYALAAPKVVYVINSTPKSQYTNEYTFRRLAVQLGFTL